MPPQVLVVFDIDGVIRDVSGSYRRALADTVEQFTNGGYRPSEEDIDRLKQEGCWNNDWEGSQELVYRYFEQQGTERQALDLQYDNLVDFFQRRYRGPDPEDPDHWSGYIAQEPLLVNLQYFEQLTQAGISWGFFSGATRGSAQFILERRLGLADPVLIAMEDAPGKPDPTGLFAVAQTLSARYGLNGLPPVIYVGDTVADMQTIQQAQRQQPAGQWLGIGVLPPHVLQRDRAYRQAYSQSLQAAGAHQVVSRVTDLAPDLIQQLF